MSRKSLIRSSVFPYHVYARSNNREWFDLPMEELWEIFSFECFAISTAYNAQIHTFTLMHNHFHLSLTTPSQNLDQCMRYFMTETSHKIARKLNRINHIYGGRYKWSIIQNARHYLLVHKYVLRNPVEAKLCNRVEEYPWTSVSRKFGMGCLDFPIHDSSLIGSLWRKNPWDELRFLNQGFEGDLKERIRRGLRRSEFELPNRI